MCHTAGSFRRGSLWVENRWREGGVHNRGVGLCVPCRAELPSVNELDVAITVAANNAVVVQPLVCEQVA